MGATMMHGSATARDSAEAPASPGYPGARVDLAREPAIRFGPIVLEPALRRLAHRDGREATLEPRVMQVIVALARAPGRIVTRDDLIEACWHGLVVGDDAITRVIGKLRRLSEQIAADGFEIETIARVGYRLLLRTPQPATPRPDRDPQAPDPDPGANAPEPPAQRLTVAEQRVTSAELSLPAKPSIAVLPFSDLSSGAEAGALGDAIAEDITVALSRYSALFVIASGSSLSYRDPNTPAGEICRELGVRFLLYGTVRRAAAGFRITVKLVDGRAGDQVWADTFDGPTGDVFALLEDVATQVVPRIDSTAEDVARRHALSRPVSSLDAYDLYWRANALFRQWRREHVFEAIALLKRILEIEPNNAWAASLAAYCHASSFASSWGPDREADRAAAWRYVDLAMRGGADDPVVLGYVAGTMVSAGGDMLVAARLIDRALALQPASPATLFWGGWVDVSAGNLARARDRFEQALRLNPRSAARAYSVTGIGICLLLTGEVEPAVAMLEESVLHLPEFPVTLAALCIAHAVMGRKAEAGRYGRSLRDGGGLDGVLTMLRDATHRQLLLDSIVEAETARE
jgi:TolB-like protein/DNA-binding winged helix-turn-helix (wHTH) protein/Flp pilus assembly protein TadD